MEIPITKNVIDNLISNEEILRNIPYFRSVSSYLKTKPNCSKCKQRQAAAAQAQTYQAVKLSLQVLPKPHLDLIKKVLGADALIIFSMLANGSTTKKVL